MPTVYCRGKKLPIKQTGQFFPNFDKSLLINWIHIWKKLACTMLMEGMSFQSVGQVIQSDNYEAAKKMLDGVEMKFRGIASNIANSETPGYKSVTLSTDFETQLKSALNSGDTSTLAELTPTLQQSTDITITKANGNNVELDHELLKMNEVALEQQFLNQYVTYSIKQINGAISGKTI